MNLFQWVVGTGNYVNDLNDLVTTAQDSQRRDLASKLVLLVIASVLVTGAMTFMAWILGNKNGPTCQCHGGIPESPFQRGFQPGYAECRSAQCQQG